MNLRDLVEKGRCVFVSCLKGPRTAEAHFKGCGKGVLFRADGYKSWRWLRLSINLLNSLFSGSPFYFVIMPHFVQKELEKSSVTKGFVRQQALKEKGEKGWDSSFCCSAVKDGSGCRRPPARLMCVWAGAWRWGSGCQNTWGLPCPDPHAGCCGHTVPAQPLSLAPLGAGSGATAQPEIHC